MLTALVGCTLFPTSAPEVPEVVEQQDVDEEKDVEMAAPGVNVQDVSIRDVEEDFPLSDSSVKGAKDVYSFGIVSVVYKSPYTVEVTVGGQFCPDCNPNSSNAPGCSPFRHGYPPSSFPAYYSCSGRDGRYVAVRIKDKYGTILGTIKMICNPTNWPLGQTVYKKFIFNLEPPKTAWFDFPITAEADFYCSWCGHWYATPRSTGEFYAVIVGINDYMYFNDLLYCVNDARDFRSKLLGYSRTPWKTSNIVLLTDRQATKAAIQQAIATMKAKMTQQDVLVFFFSGHGSYNWDSSGDEWDGYDEYLCPTDSSPYSRSYDICDDELRSWLSGCKGRIIVILDSCFAGGFVDDRTRGMTTKTKPGKPRVKLLDGFDRDLASLPRTSVLTASRADELSHEYGALSHGVFSYYVISGISPIANRGDNLVTARELFDYVAPKVASYTSGKQNPQASLPTPETNYVIVAKSHTL
jgi:hypothetical protein